MAACKKLILAFKDSGFSIMLGIPTGWREQDRDALDDPELYDVLRMADVLIPWSVGRFKDPEGVKTHARKRWAPDIVWARENSMAYMPVVFPGFSWGNHKGEGFNWAPRLGGEFFWSQVVACRKAGADMLYVAMFDEVDEGTAIFKCTNYPPGGAQFVTYEGLASDYFLRLAGYAGKVTRDHVPLVEEVPAAERAFQEK
jgi:hypothetical protein